METYVIWSLCFTYCGLWAIKKAETSDIHEPENEIRGSEVLGSANVYMSILFASVADIWHFGRDPDPRIHASD